MSLTANDDRELLSTPTRQAPVAVVFIALRFLRNLGAVNLVVAAVVIGSGRLPVGLLGVGIVACVVGLVFTILAWWRFVFTIEGDELLVSKGVVAQERLTIPLDRVQSVSIDQRFLHRLIGLVSVSVDTAGSSEAELEIDAVDRGRAEALQRLAAGAARTDTTTVPGETTARLGSGADPDDEEVLVARTPMELVKVGVARWPWAGLAALAPLIAFAGELGEFIPIDVDGESLIEDNLPEEFGRDLIVAAFGLIVAGLVLGGLLGVALQIVRQLVTEWDLRLVRTSTGLRRTAGLFSTTSRASTLNRIQALRVDETPMQRLFGIRRLSLPTIGQGDIVVPGTTEAEFTTIRAEVRPGRPPVPLDRRISRRFVFLAVRNRLIGLIPLLALAAVSVGWWALLLLVFVPLRWGTARREWRLRWWGLDAETIAERLELVNRTTAEVDLIKAQTVQVRQSFFERRRGLATVRLDTAEGHLAVPLIPLAEAEAVRDLTLHRVESDRRPWM